jgi:hypothetical protein
MIQYLITERLQPRARAQCALLPDQRGHHEEAEEHDQRDRELPAVLGGHLAQSRQREDEAQQRHRDETRERPEAPSCRGQS